MTYFQVQWVNRTNDADQGETICALPINIGRSPGNDLVLADQRASVSRRHCRVIMEDNQLVLLDQNSRNGTYVNDRRISKAIITNKATFSVGAYHITLIQQNQCSNENCKHFADYDVQLCPWCRRFMADAITKGVLYG